MSTDASRSDQPKVDTPMKRRRSTRVLRLLAFLCVVWLLLAYAIAPMFWLGFAHYDPAFDDDPRITETGDKHPGDPLNVALVGTEAEMIEIMKTAKWYPAAALGLESDLKIAVDTVLSRPDVDAPVSSLYLFGRREDIAFEQPVGDNPRHRHHVRFWKTNELSNDGRPQWIGSAVYDQHVGLSRTTGQITHVTAADIDQERNYLFECLKKTDDLERSYIVNGFHKKLEGRNGGGDPWRTDGDLYAGIISSDNK